MTKFKNKTSREMPYGAKYKAVWEWLTNDRTLSDYVIAYNAGCHPTYVGRVRTQFMAMLPKDPNPERGPEMKPVAVEVAGVGATAEPQNSGAVSVETSDLLDTRHRQYGTFASTAKTAVDIKLAVARGTKAHNLAADQRESLDLIATKMSRIANGDPNIVDHWLDIAGYATLIADRLQGHSR